MILQPEVYNSLIGSIRSFEDASNITFRQIIVIFESAAYFIVFYLFFSSGVSPVSIEKLFPMLQDNLVGLLEVIRDGITGGNEQRRFINDFNQLTSTLLKVLRQSSITASKLEKVDFVSLYLRVLTSIVAWVSFVLLKICNRIPVIILPIFAAVSARKFRRR